MVDTVRLHRDGTLDEREIINEDGSDLLSDRIASAAKNIMSKFCNVFQLSNFSFVIVIITLIMIMIIIIIMK